MVLRVCYPSGVLTFKYKFVYPKFGTLKINLSLFDCTFLTIIYVNSISFSSAREAGFVDPGAVHGNEDTVDLEGKSELGERRSHNSRLGA